MKRLARHLFTLCAALSLLLCVAACVLWVRARTGSDHAEWAYHRYLPDGSAASSQVHLNTDERRLWILVMWGEVGPYNGQLVWGYYLNADQSGGRPQFTVRRHLYQPLPTSDFFMPDPDNGTSGWGPLRWSSGSRTKAANGDDHRSVRVGVSYWLLATLLFVPPVLWLRGARRARRARTLGLCPSCGYDLRATPGRCPECGTPAAAQA